jgi:5-methylcytosine-specific restriction endonuclease McrBC GTP-binding regulatory subunit McrB
MNSSDRSLTGLDIALRRRFTFIEMPPQPKEIKNENGELLKISGKDKQGNDKDVIVADILSVMNQRIEVLLDRDHCIGHANFMILKKQPTLENLAHIFKQKIIPQLQEYFFDDWAKINLVLNGNGMLQSKSIEKSAIFPNIDSEELDYFEDKKAWELVPTSFDNIVSFTKIIQH